MRQCPFQKAGTVRYLFLIVVLLLAILVAAAIPWPSVQQVFTALITPGAPTGVCPALPPEPDYYTSGGEEAAIEAINHARADEGLPALHLPDNYWQLSPPQQQFTLVNLERTSRGLAPLGWDDTLAQIATAYSRQMVDLGFFSHTSPISGDFQTRLDANPQINGHYRTIGENIAGNSAPAAGAVYEYLYNDATEQCAHRKNILNPAFTLIGIGVVPGGPWHAMSTQELLASNPLNPYTGAPADVTAPIVHLSGVLNTTATSLSVTTNASDNVGIACITWYLDGLGQHAHEGTNWVLDASSLAPGLHHLMVYAVDDSQNYASAVLAFTVSAGHIASA
jgi:uncharacterized protein YkwD